MNYIFLDIDGVLNTPKSKVASKPNSHWFQDHLDPCLVKLLAKLVSKAKAKVIISSSWRFSLTLPIISDCLVRAGMPRTFTVAAATPNFSNLAGIYFSSYVPRGSEIFFWLDYNVIKPMVPYNYVILQRDHFVHVNGDIGLTESDVKQAIKILT